jgi:hypothetical protein
MGGGPPSFMAPMVTLADPPASESSLAAAPSAPPFIGLKALEGIDGLTTIHGKCSDFFRPSLPH